jgi:hypothetical protein
MIFVDPEQRVRNEKVLNFVAPVVEDKRAPVRLLAFSRVRVLMRPSFAASTVTNGRTKPGLTRVPRATGCIRRFPFMNSTPVPGGGMPPKEIAG